jgi:hypothetical protein
VVRRGWRGGRCAGGEWSGGNGACFCGDREWDEKERRGRLWLKGLEKSRDKKRKINKEIEK